MTESLSRDDRQLVKQRAGFCCEYCRSQARFATQSFSVEHILPRSRGGTTQLENLGFACQGCNNHKYNHTDARDPVTEQLVPLFHPRQQEWSEQFTWNDEFTLIIGITPTGRASVEALHLNREALVNLRRLLFAAGEHPPPDSQEEEHRREAEGGK